MYTNVKGKIIGGNVLFSKRVCITCLKVKNQTVFWNLLHCAECVTNYFTTPHGALPHIASAETFKEAIKLTESDYFIKDSLIARLKRHNLGVQDLAWFYQYDPQQIRDAFPPDDGIEEGFKVKELEEWLAKRNELLKSGGFLEVTYEDVEPEEEEEENDPKSLRNLLFA